MKTLVLVTVLACAVVLAAPLVLATGVLESDWSRWVRGRDFARRMP